MNNELQELLIQIIKAAMIAIPIWGLIIVKGHLKMLVLGH